MEYTIINTIKDRAWYVMKASYGKALKAKIVLDSLSIENFVPLCYKKTKVNGRNKIITVAAIPNLIFINADTSQLEQAKLRLDYLHNMLIKSDEGANILEPMVVPELDMRRFIKVVEDAKDKVKFVDIATNQQIISKGTRVRIINGEYEGYEGLLCRPKGSRAKKVLLDICGIALVELPVADIELLEKI